MTDQRFVRLGFHLNEVQDRRCPNCGRKATMDVFEVAATFRCCGFIRALPRLSIADCEMHKHCEETRKAQGSPHAA